MSSPRTISFRIAPERVEELDILAKAMDRDRTYLLNEAVESYLTEQRRFAALVEEGRQDIRSGKTFTHEEVHRLAGEWEREGR